MEEKSNSQLISWIEWFLLLQELLITVYNIIPLHLFPKQLLLLSKNIQYANTEVDAYALL
jgi:hypothetical protein